MVYPCPSGTRSSTEPINGTLFQTCVPAPNDGVSSVRTIVGATIGSVIGAVCLVFLCGWLVWRRTHPHAASGDEAVKPEDATRALSTQARADFEAGILSAELLTELTDIRHEELAKGLRFTMVKLLVLANKRSHRDIEAKISQLLGGE